MQQHGCGRTTIALHNRRAAPGHVVCQARGPALGVRMKSDGRYAAPVLGIQFSYRPNQAYRGLTPVDHCNSSWKRDCQRVGHSLSVGAPPGPKNGIVGCAVDRC